MLKLLSHFFLTPEQGADTAIYLAAAPELSRVTGQYYYRRLIQQLSPRAENAEEAARLWQWSLEQTGLT
ncbi:oxidoreductase [compost metagenome]